MNDTNEGSSPLKKTANIPYGLLKKGQARVAAIQIGYSHDMSDPGEDTDTLILSYMQHYRDDDSEEKEVEPDLKFVKKLVRGVQEQLDELDVLIAAHLTEKWTIPRLDGVMRSLLRVAVFELKNFPKTGIKTIINEYITISKGFFNIQEVRFVNGILDAIGHKLRTEG